MKYIIFIILTTLLISCSGMDDLLTTMSGMGVITERDNTFDDSIIIEVSPNWLYTSEDNWSVAPIRLGAQWHSSVPDQIMLTLLYSSSIGSSNAYLNISGLSLNIDGKRQHYKTNGLTTYKHSGYTLGRATNTDSENIVVIPRTVFEHMLTAQDCRLRVHTLHGGVNANFSVPRLSAGGTTAIVTLRKFNDKVMHKITALRQQDEIFGGL